MLWLSFLVQRIFELCWYNIIICVRCFLVLKIWTFENHGKQRKPGFLTKMRHLWLIVSQNTKMSWIKKLYIRNHIRKFKESVYQKWKSQHHWIKLIFSSLFSNFRKIIFVSNSCALLYIFNSIYFIIKWKYSLGNLGECFHCQLIWDRL